MDYVKEYSNSEDIKKSKELYYKKTYGGEEDDDGNIIESLTEDDKLFLNNLPSKIDFLELADFNKCIINSYELN